MRPRIEVVGQRFGRLVVTRNSERRVKGRWRVECVCDCGAIVECDPRSLRAGHTKSCGCYQKSQVGAACVLTHTTHGKAGTPEYNIWHKIRRRCKNPKDAKYAIYGGRGIKVCARWDASFEAFLSDMGERPSERHSIDRINVDGDYSPENCRWATNVEQARNKRHHRYVEFDGKCYPLSQACEMAGVKYRAALFRLNTGRDWLPPPPKG